MYIAQVHRRPLKRVVELHLLSFERRGLWQLLIRHERVTVPLTATNLGNFQLVLVEISKTGKVLKIVDGASAIPLLLHKMSLQIVKLLRRDAEFTEWKESLEYQALELNERQQWLDYETERLEAKHADILEQEVILQEDQKKLTNERRATKTALDHIQKEQKRLSEL